MAEDAADIATVADVLTSDLRADTDNVIGRGDASASVSTQGGVVVTGSVFCEREDSNGRVGGAVRVVLECPISKSAVAESAGGTSECLKTDGSANTKLFEARGSGSKTMERLKTKRGIGAGNGVVFQRLPTNSHVRTDIERFENCRRCRQWCC